MLTGFPDDVFNVVVGHPLDQHAFIEDLRHNALVFLQLGDVPFAHDENHLAGDVAGVEYPSEIVEKDVPLLGTS
ncbi:hypothetical protein D3C87_1866210 [compost metagenome]